jgi:hypothetical protein
MHNLTGDHRKLLFKYAVLSARFEIREFFLKYAVKDVYENIGQVLSFVRMQLASFNTNDLTEKPEDILQSGNLVGQSIRDLRSMCRSFYPDKELLKDGGFVDAIELTIRVLQPGVRPAVVIKGEPVTMHGELKLITFKILQDILVIINEVNGAYKNLVISYMEDNITLTTRYVGSVINWQKNRADDISDSLTIPERIEMFDGQMNLKQSKNGITSIILKLPLNISL